MGARRIKMGLELHRLRDKEYAEIAWDTVTDECFSFHGVKNLKIEFEAKYFESFKDKFSKEELTDWINNNSELYDEDEIQENMKLIKEIYE